MSYTEAQIRHIKECIQNIKDRFQVLLDEKLPEGGMKVVEEIIKAGGDLPHYSSITNYSNTFKSAEVAYAQRIKLGDVEGGLGDLVMYYHNYLHAYKTLIHTNEDTVDSYFTTVEILSDELGKLADNLGEGEGIQVKAGEWMKKVRADYETNKIEPDPEVKMPSPPEKQDSKSSIIWSSCSSFASILSMTNDQPIQIKIQMTPEDKRKAKIETKRTKHVDENPVLKVFGDKVTFIESSDNESTVSSIADVRDAFSAMGGNEMDDWNADSDGEEDGDKLKRLKEEIKEKEKQAERLKKFGIKVGHVKAKKEVYEEMGDQTLPVIKVG